MVGAHTMRIHTCYDYVHARRHEELLLRVKLLM